MKNNLIVYVVLIMITFSTVIKAEDLLLKKGEELIELTELKVKNEDYIKNMTDQSSMLDIVEELGKIDYSNPKGMYEVTVSDLNLVDTFLSLSKSELPPKLTEEIKMKVLMGIPMIINSKVSNVSLIATFSLLTSSKVFIDKSLKKLKLNIYIYNNKYSIMNIFIPTNDNIVTVVSGFIYSEDISKVSSIDEMKKWINENIPYLKKIKVEKL